MRFLPAIMVLVGLVMLMAGPGRKGVQTGQQIGLVILGLLILTALFAVVVNRAL